MRLTAAPEALTHTAAAAAPTSLDFGALFSGLEKATGIVAAISGGPDSTVLLQGLARWRESGARPPILAATVDHGLRPEAAEEARGVAAAATEIGLPHRVLTWAGAKPRTRVQERARDERYRRLLALAREVGASHVATGHTLDDQAETVLMRLIAGSGIGGLAGMRPQTVRDGITLVRPFLGLRKSILVDSCRAEGWPYRQDPSNLDRRFARPRLRAGLMPALAVEGLTPERLSALSRRAGRDADALEARAQAVLAAIRVDLDGPSRFVLDGMRLKAEPDAILLRVVAQAIASAAGPLTGSVRLETLEKRILGDLRPALHTGQAHRLNLGGVLLDLRSDGRLFFSPEPPRRTGGG